jgi:hypothetical protein
MSKRLPVWIVMAALAGLVVLGGCKPKPAAPSAATSETTARDTPAVDQQPPQADAQALPAHSPATTAAPVTRASWAPDALEELLAPIALYPDQLLGQILAASVNAQEVLDAGNWLLQNQQLEGDALDAAATKAGFGPPMRALLPFPSVVDMLCQRIDWTRQLGAAFTSDQKSVLDAVQRLRAQAQNAGSLRSTPEQKVETHAEGEKVVVEVKPANPKVVYVPQYDPAAVYASPPATPAPSTQTSPASDDKDTVSTGAAVAGGLLAFGVGVALGKAFSDHDDYYYPHWSTGVVVVGPRPFYPPAYVYRPAYGPAFHPAYRYTSPPGYRYAYNSPKINVNRNVVVNNNNYFNRFENNRNVRVDAGTWKGRTTYAGTQNNAGARRLDTPQRGDVSQRMDAQRRADARDTAARASGAAALQRIDRGYGQRDGGHVEHSATSVARPAPATRPAVEDALERRTSTETRSPAGAQARIEPTRIARADTPGAFDRAASARGRASVAGRPARDLHRR